MSSEPSRGRRHRFDPGALIAGLFFLAVAVTHLLTSFGHHRAIDVTVALPIFLAAMAVVVTIRLLTRSRRRDHSEDL